MNKPPDFFLSSAGEYKPLSVPRACWTRERLRDQARDDHMLIEIEPPLIGQSFGRGGEDITRLIISTRHQGETLFPITTWPASVYVARILDENVIEARMFKREQVELIAWAMIFSTRDEAAVQADKLAQ
ncbi:MAG: hypothetical protein HS122_15515 [Opitutaceae bacterium]|nr:hypothetical protein [Opitutaceae bacterium]